MALEDEEVRHHAAREADSKATTLSPGKRTLTEAVGMQLSANASGAAPTNHTDPGAIQQAAAQGLAGGDATLPHSHRATRDRDLFFHHEVRSGRWFPTPRTRY
ncbi:MAG TPA: hypothetical protein VF516_14515 [Kofleriaceae bacterium]